MPNRARFSPSPAPPVSSAQNPTIHHYPQHHLPGQRITAAPTRLGAPSRLSRPGNQRHSEESGASSASSEPRASTETTKISQPRSSTSAASNHTAGSIPPARGRFKTALSTFRRTTPMVTNLSPSKASNNPNNNGTSPVTVANSQPEKLNGMDAAPSTTNSSAQNVPKSASKLKQPSTIVGRRWLFMHINWSYVLLMNQRQFDSSDLAYSFPSPWPPPHSLTCHSYRFAFSFVGWTISSLPTSLYSLINGPDAHSHESCSALFCSI